MNNNVAKLISSHLSEHKIPKKQVPVLVPKGAICAFTGETIEKGVPIEVALSDNFTEWEYVRYPSSYVGIRAALCILPVLSGASRPVALRNYSYYVDNEGIRLLKHPEILPLVLDIPSTPFVFVVSYGNKKHTAYKAALNTDRQNFIVTTDQETQVPVNLSEISNYLSIMQRWYTVVNNTKAAPTAFTKNEIAGEFPVFSRIEAYGMEKFEEENKLLEKYRQTATFKLILFSLTKINPYD